jgi:probable phosphoglycerate mutase
MAIFVIRHGETPGNAARVVQTPETELSSRGLEQADRLARRLASEYIGGILSSDLVRAAMTAERLAATTGAAVTHEPLLQERNFGAVRGRAYADLEFDLFAPDFEPPEGESWSVFHARVTSAWARIRTVAAATPGHLAVVTHGLVCHSLAQHHFSLASLGPSAEVPLRFENTSLTVVEAAPPWEVRRLNCAAHLTSDSAPDLGAGVA